MFVQELDTSIMDNYMMEKQLLRLVPAASDARRDERAIWESWELGRGPVRLHFNRDGHLILTIG